MRSINRRSFLGGAIALTAFAVLPVDAKAGLPRVVGDGVHDDAPGIQALIDGKPALIEGKVLQVAAGGTIHFPSGTYRLGHTLVISPDRVLEAERVKFIATHGGPVIDARLARVYSFSDLEIHTRGSGPAMIVRSMVPITIQS